MLSCRPSSDVLGSIFVLCSSFFALGSWPFLQSAKYKERGAKSQSLACDGPQAKSPVHSQDLPGYVCAFDAREEDGHVRHVFVIADPLHRDHLFLNEIAGLIADGGAHVRLDESRCDGIDSHTATGQLHSQCAGE